MDLITSARLFLEDFSGIDPQLPISILLVILAFLLKKRTARGWLMLLAIVLQFRYLAWRGIYTLDSPSNLGLFLTATLFAAEGFGFIQSLLFYRQLRNARKLRDEGPLLPDGHYPKVDIFVPVVNEPLAILKRTLTGCLAQDYPRENFTVHVLDDGGRAEVRKLTAELGCNYIRRESREYAKAGNLNNALLRTNAELVAIFDMDHVPAVDFLKSTVPFFRDEKMGFVQSPHYFYNPDTLQKNLGLEKDIRNEQDLFFRLIQPGRDFKGSCLFCGSSAIFRRSALLDAGGFHLKTVTEDIHTSLILHAKGWKSKYVNRTLSAALCPESKWAYLKQRARWTKGGVQVMLHDNPLFKKGLSFSQRLDYFSSVLYFFFGIPRIIFLITPLFFLLLGLSPINSEPGQLLHYFFSYFIAASLVMALEVKDFRKFLWSDVYETLLCFSVAGAALKTLFLKQGPRFEVTPKGEAGYDRKKIRGGVMHLGTLGALLFALASSFLSPPENKSALAISAFWGGFNCVLLVFALLASVESPQRRAYIRIRKKIECYLEDERKKVQAETVDLSERGVSVLLSAETYFGEKEIILEFPKTPGIEGALRLPCHILRQESRDGRTEMAVAFSNLGGEEYRGLLLQMFGSHVEEELESRIESPKKDLALIKKAFMAHFRRDTPLRRAYPRFPLEVECSFVSRSRALKWQSAKTLNVSFNGLLLEHEGMKVNTSESVFVQLEGATIEARPIAVKKSKGKRLLHLKVISVPKGKSAWQIMTLPYEISSKPGITVKSDLPEDKTTSTAV